MKTLGIIILFIILPKLGSAQQGWVFAGGESDGTGGVSSFTLGQLFFEYQSKTAGAITPGLQQSVSLKQTHTLVTEPDFRPAYCFPNPAIQGDLVFWKGVEGNGKLRCYAMNGNCIYESSTAVINTSGFLPGLYILEWHQGDVLQVIRLEILN